jgi:hypothetical protein
MTEFAYVVVRSAQGVHLSYSRAWKNDRVWLEY